MTNLKCKIFLKGRGEGRRTERSGVEIIQRGGAMWFVGCSQLERLAAGTVTQNTVPVPGTRSWEQDFPSPVTAAHTEQAAQQPGPLAHPWGCTFLCLLDPGSVSGCKMMLGVSALPSDEERLLQQGGSQIWVPHLLQEQILDRSVPGSIPVFCHGNEFQRINQRCKRWLG